MAEKFVDIHCEEGEATRIAFRSGMVVYHELFMEGQYVGMGFNAAGFRHPVRAGDRPAIPDHPCPQAFWVDLDGQLLASRWSYEGTQQRQVEGGLEAVTTLRHEVRPVVIRVHTVLDGTEVMVRRLEIENTSDKPAALSAAYPLAGILQEVAHPPGAHGTPYSLGYFRSTHWGLEGDFAWRPLDFDTTRISGRYREDRHRHPMYVIRNNATGEHFFGQLAWSGGFAFEFDVDTGDQANAPARLSFRVGPEGPAPQCVIQPRETVSTPELHFGALIGDLDAVTQSMHRHLRRSVLLPGPEDRVGLVEGGIGPEQEITEELVLHDADMLADLGAEVFFVDASWYAPPGGSWYDRVGDWEVNRERFPNGMRAVRDYVHRKGMLFGLWMEPERLGCDSETLRKHPDWTSMTYRGKRRASGQLDMSDPDIWAWIESKVDGLIGGLDLDFFRLDYNIGNTGMDGCCERDGYVENTSWRYYEFMYPMWRRLRGRYPDVIFENCASGGGRTDIGFVPNFTHTWVTDWQQAPRSFMITNGMSIALPPERIDRLLGLAQETWRTGDIDFQARLAIFVHPTVSCHNQTGTKPNPVQMARTRHAVDVYKSFVRPMHPTSRVYHHTPQVDSPEPTGWGVLELAAEDRTMAMAGLFRLSDPAEPEYLLKFRGIDASKRYRVTLDNTGTVCELDGFALTHRGVWVRLETPLTSELILAEAE